MTEAVLGKPLGRKAYGSIGHLPGSRMGPADRTISPGQGRIATERTRDRYDFVVVQEKLDGSNVAVARIDGCIVPLNRAGYVVNTSPYEQHWRLGEWAYSQQARFLALLEDGDRVCGEWLMQAHGTRYSLPHEPFVAFDIMRGERRALWEEVSERLSAQGFTLPHTLHAEFSPFPIARALSALGKRGHHGAMDDVEGAVWRVERKGKIDFLAKYVRPDKQDGTYLPGCCGNPKNAEPVWNWRPEWAS
jgi:hypothetical protein